MKIYLTETQIEFIIHSLSIARDEYAKCADIVLKENQTRLSQQFENQKQKCVDLIKYLEEY